MLLLARKRISVYTTGSFCKRVWNPEPPPFCLGFWNFNPLWHLREQKKIPDRLPHAHLLVRASNHLSIYGSWFSTVYQQGWFATMLRRNQQQSLRTKSNNDILQEDKEPTLHLDIRTKFIKIEESKNHDTPSILSSLHRFPLSSVRFAVGCRMFGQQPAICRCRDRLLGRFWRGSLSGNLLADIASLLRRLRSRYRRPVHDGGYHRPGPLLGHCLWVLRRVAGKRLRGPPKSLS